MSVECTHTRASIAQYSILSVMILHCPAHHVVLVLHHFLLHMFTSAHLISSPNESSLCITCISCSNISSCGIYCICSDYAEMEWWKSNMWCQLYKFHQNICSQCIIRTGSNRQVDICRHCVTTNGDFIVNPEHRCGQVRHVAKFGVNICLKLHS